MIVGVNEVLDCCYISSNYDTTAEHMNNRPPTIRTMLMPLYIITMYAVLVFWSSL